MRLPRFASARAVPEPWSVYDSNFCMLYSGRTCRDRATKDPQNAIQRAHEENHAGKAMETVLSRAAQDGVQFCEGMPLVPTLQEVTRHLAGQRHTKAKSTRIRATLKDDPGDGELTFFLGKGARLKDIGHEAGREVRQAVGFFMYTQCAENNRGEWPSVMGACLELQRSDACLPL